MAGDARDEPSTDQPEGWWSAEVKPRRAAPEPPADAGPPAGPQPPTGAEPSRRAAPAENIGAPEEDATRVRYEFAEPTVPVERRWDPVDSLFRPPSEQPEGPAEGSGPAPRRVPESDASDANFRRTVALTVAGTVLPGLGLIAARRRIAGGIVLGAFAAALLGLGAWALIDRNGLLSVAVRPTVLRPLAIVLLVVALIWVGVVVGTHLNLRGSGPTRTQRMLGGVLVGVLAFAVAAPMAVAARYSFDQAGLVSTVFRSEEKSKSATRPTITTTDNEDPWADRPRVNILLLGGDAGADREGNRTDTVILASIDTKTGDTVLISLPRNTARMPFPTDSALSQYYPYGFTNGDGDNAEFFLNAMYDNVPAAVPADVLGSTDNLGADAMKLSVGEALGLKVDYYVLIDLAGFRQLVNALGGITVNINTWVAIGGSTDEGRPPGDSLRPGPEQHLDGEHALWFARGRFGADDFARMDRQRCVIDAIIQQANPANVLTRYEAIAKAGKDIVRTDIPQEVLPMMVDLSMRVKDGNVRSIVFKHGVDGFSSPNPNFELMRQRVKVALGEAKAAKKPAKPKPSTTPKKPVKSSSPGKSQPPTAQSEDVASSCAYDKAAADQALANPPYWAHP